MDGGRRRRCSSRTSPRSPGFASLAIGPIIPVRVFGLLVAFGTLVILLMSFTLVPALMALAREERPASRAATCGGRAAPRRGSGAPGVASAVEGCRGRGRDASSWPSRRSGIAQIRINNNMVAWFKPGSDDPRGGPRAEPGARRHGDALPRGRRPAPDAVTEPRVPAGPRGAPAEPRARARRGQDHLGGGRRQARPPGAQRRRPGRRSSPTRRRPSRQALLLFSMAARPRELANVVDDPYQKANLVVQLRSWDAVDTRALLATVQRPPRRAARFPGPR